MKFKILSVIITAMLLTGCASAPVVAPGPIANPPEQSGVVEKESDIEEPVAEPVGEPATPIEAEPAPSEEPKQEDVTPEPVKTSTPVEDVVTAPKPVEKPVEPTLYSLSNYTGKTLSEAKKGIGTNFALTVVEENHSSVASGKIISQTPSSGSHVKGTKVKIIVSKGLVVTPPKVEEPTPTPTPTPTPPPVVSEPAPTVKMIELKDGTGKIGIDFANELARLGFPVNIHEIYHPTVGEKLVIEMLTKPGLYPVGTNVEISVSRGVDPSTIPASSWTKDFPNNYNVTYQGTMESELVTLLNEYRTANGLGALTAKSDLKNVARWKSESMIQLNYFAHANPTLDDIGAFDLTRKVFGYTHYMGIGENLHTSYGEGVSATAQDIMNAWKNSPGHNTNMLRPEWKSIGIGVAYAAKSGSRFQNTSVYTATQIFGK